MDSSTEAIIARVRQQMTLSYGRGLDPTSELVLAELVKHITRLERRVARAEAANKEMGDRLLSIAYALPLTLIQEIADDHDY